MPLSSFIRLGVPGPDSSAIGTTSGGALVIRGRPRAIVTSFASSRGSSPTAPGTRAPARSVPARSRSRLLRMARYGAASSSSSTWRYQTSRLPSPATAPPVAGRRSLAAPVAPRGGRPCRGPSCRSANAGPGRRAWPDAHWPSSLLRILRAVGRRVRRSDPAWSPQRSQRALCCMRPGRPSARPAQDEGDADGEERTDHRPE
jgi:hypothetical protein